MIKKITILVISISFLSLTTVTLAAEEPLFDFAATLENEMDTATMSGEIIPTNENYDKTAQIEIVDESDTEAPTVIQALAKDKNTVSISFSEEILLPIDRPEIEFNITEEFDKTVNLAVVSAKLDENDPSIVILETESQTKGISYNVIVSSNITDLANNPIVSGIMDTVNFTGSNKIHKDILIDTPPVEPQPIDIIPPAESQPIDIIAPENITNFLLKLEETLGKYLVKMSWNASLNSSGDLVDQLLYTSLDSGKNYDNSVSLGPTTTNHEIKNLEEGTEYTFKITTKDINGNESSGLVKSIRLPKTGPAIVFLAISSGLAGIIWNRRKKK